MLDALFGGASAPNQPKAPVAQRQEAPPADERDASDHASVFVGREAELRRLHAALDRTMAGHGSPIFIAGEPGAGKSTLMHRFLHEAQERYPEAIVAVGECNSRSGP